MHSRSPALLLVVALATASAMVLEVPVAVDDMLHVARFDSVSLRAAATPAHPPVVVTPGVPYGRCCCRTATSARTRANSATSSASSRWSCARSSCCTRCSPRSRHHPHPPPAAARPPTARTFRWPIARTRSPVSTAVSSSYCVSSRHCASPCATVVAGFWLRVFGRACAGPRARAALHL